MQAILPKIAVEAGNDRALLRLKITAKSLVALFALMICTSELHEQIHIQTGRIICGGYGVRDFNSWQTAAGCAAPAWAFLATLAGPLWSYAVMWTGAVLLTKAETPRRKAIGFALVFAPLPFARIFTAATGGGDEKVVLHWFLQNDLNLATTKILTAIVVAAICLPPMLIALKHVKNRHAFLYVAGFAILPLVIIGLYVFKLLNPLLASGVLSQSTVLGTPVPILAYFALMAIVLVFCRRWLLEIGDHRELKRLI